MRKRRAASLEKRQPPERKSRKFGKGGVGGVRTEQIDEVILVNAAFSVLQEGDPSNKFGCYTQRIRSLRIA